MAMKDGRARVSVAAVDLGAASGRVARVDFNGLELEIEVIRRFPHNPQARGSRLEWNLPFLWSEISSGLSQLANSFTPASVGVDTWGVDYGLYDATGGLIENPLAYREQARIDAFDQLSATIGTGNLYMATGNQVMAINTLFGLAAENTQRPGMLESASLMLMMADIFHRKLAGTAVTEFSMASTSGMLDMRTGTWAYDLLDQVGIPRHILPELVQPGTLLGPVVGELSELGLAGVKVIVPAAHDTASAVLAIPHTNDHTMFISSGTWSLVGVVTDKPLINAKTLGYNLTNEGGYGGSIRLLRNVMGLWMLQESRRTWAGLGDDADFATLVAQAEREPKLQSMVDPSDSFFFPPGDMPRRIQDYCRAVGQPVPETRAQVVRTIIDSLAMGYRQTMDIIAEVTGTPIEVVRVVGGGSLNAALQQATADATGLPTMCGAVEATALGNAAAQLITLGEFSNVEEAWDAISRTSKERLFEPQDYAIYNDKYAEFCSLAGNFSRQQALQRG